MAEYDTDSSFSEDMPVPYERKDKSKTYREIILEAIEKCRIEGSKEMKKGFEGRVLVDGVWRTVQSNIDQRKIFIQCVKALQDLVEYSLDDKSQEEIEDINEKLKESPKIFFARYLKQEVYPPYIEMSKKTGTIVSGEKSPVGERILQEWEDYKTEQYRNIYRTLLLLFKRKNELKGVRTISYDE